MRRLPTINAYMMTKRRATAAGLGNQNLQSQFPGDWHHGIFEEIGGTLEKDCQHGPISASTRTTQLYDRRSDEGTLDEVERVGI